MSDALLVYIATAPCGCVHGIECEDGADAHYQLAEWLKAGSSVSRVTLSAAKATLASDCPHALKWGRA